MLKQRIPSPTSVPPNYIICLPSLLIYILLLCFISPAYLSICCLCLPSLLIYILFLYFISQIITFIWVASYSLHSAHAPACTRYLTVWNRNVFIFYIYYISVLNSLALRWWRPLPSKTCLKCAWNVWSTTCVLVWFTIIFCMYKY